MHHHRSLSVFLLILVPLVIGGTLTVPTSRAEAQNQDQAEGQDDAILEAIGGAAAIGAYNACAYVGALADGLQAGTYTPEYVQIRLGGLTGGMKMCVQQLDRLNEADIAAEDKQAVRQVTDVYKRVMRAADALATYATDKTRANATLFQTARQNAWDDVATLLGFDPEAKRMLEPGGGRLRK